MQTPFMNPDMSMATKAEAAESKAAERSNSPADQLLFKSRFVMVFGEVDDKMARRVTQQLIALSQDSDAPIQVLISSPGGHVESGDVIHDMIRFVRAPVTTIGTGWVASAGTHIFLAADKARRVCLPNTRFMIHQPSGGAGGQATDIAIQAREIIKTRERIAAVVARQTGQALDKVKADMERDHWLSAEEAVGYGMVSRIIAHQKDLA